MSREVYMNYPSGHQIPPDPPREDAIVEGMLRECGRLSQRLFDIRYEQDEAVDYLRGLRYVDGEIVDLIADGYGKKLYAEQTTLNEIRARLNELGYDYNGKG